MSFSIVLYDDCPSRRGLLPLVATRPVSNLRVGVLTINEKWELLFKREVSYITIDYLRGKFPLQNNLSAAVLVIKGSVLPSDELLQAVRNLGVNQKLISPDGKEWIALMAPSIDHFSVDELSHYTEIPFPHAVDQLCYPQDIFLLNSNQIEYDLRVMQFDNIKATLVDKNTFVGDNIYIEKNAKMQGVFLDSSKGSIYIGKNVLLETGVVIHGPAAIGDDCRLKTGAVIYANVTVGPSSTICGELTNVVIWGNAAKGHAGYLGCSVVGEGCNLGAGTTNSNLRNDWSVVKSYDYTKHCFRDTQLTKCGAIIGDQAMLGIQSMLTTGTVIGVGAQVAMSKFIPKFVPDFSWLTDDKYDSYAFDRFIGMMQRKSKFKNENFTADDEVIYQYIYRHTRELRDNNQH